MRGQLFGVLIMALLSVFGLAATARAESRHTVIEDGPDPSVAFDLERVAVTLDNSTGSLRFDVTLWRPPPPPDAANDGLRLRIDVNRDPLECYRYGTGAVLGSGIDLDKPSVLSSGGDFSLSVGPTTDYAAAPPAPRYAASGYPGTLYQQPVALSPDGRSFSVSFQDAALIGADLRCISGNGGLQKKDPNEYVDAAPGVEGRWAEFFSGYIPRFRVSYQATTPQRLRPASAGRYVNLAHYQRCTFDCDVTVSGYATAGGRLIPGLPLTAKASIPAKRDDSIAYSFSAAERVRLKDAFERYGRVQFVLRIRAEDGLGRVQKMTRRITLLPTGAKQRGRSTAGNQGGRDGGDRDCSDFSSQRQAQEYFDANGGSSSANVDGLDSDHDGTACETLS